MQRRRSRVWCVFVAHDKQIRERKQRPSAKKHEPYQLSGVLWKARTFQSKPSMAICFGWACQIVLWPRCLSNVSNASSCLVASTGFTFKNMIPGSRNSNKKRLQRTIIERFCFWKPTLRMTPCMAPDQHDAGRPCCWVWPSAVSAASAAAAFPGVHWPPSLATGGHSCKRPWSRQNAMLFGRIPLHPKLTLGSAKV